MLNLAILLEASAQDYPDQLAVIFNDRKITYAQLNAAANMFANGLRKLGVQRGDKVALMMPNLPFFPIAYYGILKAGATVVPFNVLFTAREVAYHLQDSDAVVLVGFAGFFEPAYGGFKQVDACRSLIVANADPSQPFAYDDAAIIDFNRFLGLGGSPVFDTVQTQADDTAVILYTSGTTGNPKGAQLSHSNMVMNADICLDLLEAKPGDVALVTLPLFHSFGQTVLMNGCFMAGATLTLLPRFTPDAALGIMQRDGVTIFAGVPTMYWALFSYPHAEEQFDMAKIAGQLHTAVSGGSALPVELLRNFEARFKVPILEGYGLSETSPVASFNLRRKVRKPGSIGIPVWGIQMALVDENENLIPKPSAEGEFSAVGEIVVRGHNVMKGYYKRPEATAEVMKGDWFHTGDLARLDSDGYFFIVDRKKEMILRGGFNVYPREVEEFLMTHPKVSLVAVKAVPDDKLGEEVKAFIVLKAGQSATADEIIDFAKTGLASYKYPRTIEFRSELPMTATGKILKRELKD
ncbi:MAG: long-chain fatty acid--CoA ligase [Caldilineales bacterium]|nr:long-chain fatty acid--CoA ligase [Caldilineales bacterium]MCW5860831.1 long-chain fatty acid--CoA ligase [Caldilineales bacterium]